MNGNKISGMPSAGNVNTQYSTGSLIFSLQNHTKFTQFSLLFSVLVAAMLFAPTVPISALMPSFYIEFATFAFGLLASLLLLRTNTWRPFYFPMVAFLPISLLFLIGVQIALHLTAYWQQHVLVICYLIWATLLILLGAELRREFDLKKMVPVLASAMLVLGFLNVLCVFFLQWSPPILGVGLAFLSLAYLWASKRITHMASAVLSILLLGTAVYAHQNSLSALPQNLLFFLQNHWILATESLHIFLENPLLGAGWGQFAWQDLQLAQVYTQHTGIIKYPQNLLLQLLAETGLIGFAMVVFSLGFWLNRVWKSHALESNINQLNANSLCSNQTGASLEQQWLYSILALLSIIALFNNGLAYAPVLGLFAFILGLLEERIIKLHTHWSLKLANPALLGQCCVAILLAFGATTLISTYRQYTTLEYWYANTAQFTQFKNQQLLPLLSTLGALRHQSLLTTYIDMGIVRALPNNANVIEDKLVINTQLLQHSPQATEVYNQIHLLALSGLTKQAIQQLQLAIIRHPNHLYDFSINLLKNQTKQVLPLLLIIVRHNKKEIAKEQAEVRAKQANI